MPGMGWFSVMRDGAAAFGVVLGLHVALRRDLKFVVLFELPLPFS